MKNMNYFKEMKELVEELKKTHSHVPIIENHLQKCYYAMELLISKWEASELTIERLIEASSELTIERLIKETKK